MITPKQKKELIAFAKWRWPVGTTIWDPTCSEPYTIKKRTVYEIMEWDYSERFMPDKDEDFNVDFLVRDPGKYTRFHSLKTYPKKWCKIRTND